MDENQVVGYSNYANQTMVHTLGLLAIAVLGLCLLFLPRKWSILPFLIMTCFVSSAQRIVIVTLDFDYLRIMVLFGVARLFLRKEYVGFRWTLLDRTLIAWAVSAILLNVIQIGTVSALVNRLGFGFDVFGMYFVFRCLIKNWVDLDRIILAIILISIPVVVFFVIENLTGKNVFSVFGGVPKITSVREGRLRCQGAFSHPILAGCFWSAVLPLVVAYWWKGGQSKIWTTTGVICALIVISCCASSTPVLGIASAIVGGFMFNLRKQMRAVRWGIFFSMIGLHIVMKAPVWHLVSRVSAVGGSTGWHRFNLINQSIINFSDWWFCGCSGLTVLSWGIWKGDVTNQYILEGVRGGFLTMCLFIAIIVIAFGNVGSLWRQQVCQQYRTALAWALGVSLFTHSMMFIGVNYFGQIWIAWYLLLAIIGSLCSVGPSKTRRTYKSQRPDFNKKIRAITTLRAENVLS